MKLQLGNHYDPSKLTLVGWTDGDGSGHEGYEFAAYFTLNGQYVGPDHHGIEPVVEWNTDRDGQIAELRNHVAALQSMVGVLGNSGLDDVYDCYLDIIKGTAELAVRVTDGLIGMHREASGS